MSAADSWPHAPPHYTNDRAIYMVTASTYEKRMLLGSRKRLRYMQERLLEISAQRGWRIQAWAMLANHYHFIASSPDEGAESLALLIKQLHADSARFVNALDHAKGRKVWHNYWESQLSYEK